MHHRVNIRSRLENGAVDEALQIGRAPARIDGGAVERELHDVVRLDAVRRARPREQKMLRLVRMTHADMPERSTIFTGEDAVGGDKFFEQFSSLAIGSPGSGTPSTVMPGTRLTMTWRSHIQYETHRTQHLQLVRVDEHAAFLDAEAVARAAARGGRPTYSRMRS